MDFSKLISNIEDTHWALHHQAIKAINVNLTLRNYFIGLYIVEYEQNGEDRAQYGQKLILNIAKKIAVKGFSETNLKLYRQFYNSYPDLLSHILESDSVRKLISQPVADQLSLVYKQSLSISQTPSDELQNTNNEYNTISQTVSDEFNKNKHILTLIKKVSFSHFVELIKLPNETKRRFYELLILKTTPSVKELKRQIETLSFERLGFSNDSEIALNEIENKIAPQASTDLVKTHYCFDFLNIRQPQLLEESELEQALIDHLQQFLIELGNGFCFEGRQKRILIGDEYYSIDLVFYHRLLKCHVLIDLKTKHAKHENIGQLKAYIEHYKRNVMQENDNPPVGILLVTGQNKTLVEYAIADADKELFVSQYLLTLPNQKELENLIENEINNWVEL